MVRISELLAEHRSQELNEEVDSSELLEELQHSWVVVSSQLRQICGVAYDLPARMTRWRWRSLPIEKISVKELPPASLSTVFLISNTSRRTSSWSAGSSSNADKTLRASFSLPQRSRYRGDSGKKAIIIKAGKMIRIEKAMGKRQATDEVCTQENPKESQ